MDRKNKILASAQLLFSRFGLKKVTTDDIAREANVSKATIYRYYKNKQEIFQDVVKLEADKLLDAIKKGVEKEKTVAAKFKSHLFTKMSTIRELINFYEVTQKSDDYYWPFVAEARAQFIQEEKNIVKGILEAGNRNNEIHVANTDLVAHMMVVSLQAQEYAWAIETLNISLEEYVNLMIDVVINGIKKEKRSRDRSSNSDRKPTPGVASFIERKAASCVLWAIIRQGRPPHGRKIIRIHSIYPSWVPDSL